MRQTTTVTNLPPVEGREQLSAVTKLVMMSDFKQGDAFVCLRKIVHLSEQQEDAIRLAIKGTYENAMINPYTYGNKRGRPAGTTNKPGHKAGRPPKSTRTQAAAGSNSLSIMFAASSGNTILLATRWHQIQGTVNMNNHLRIKYSLLLKMRYCLWLLTIQPRKKEERMHRASCKHMSRAFPMAHSSLFSSISQ